MKRFIIAVAAMLLMLQTNGLKAENTRSWEVTGMTVEYAAEPLGIETESPRFSWRIEAGDERGVRQKAYRIEVRDESGHKVWSSGKVKDSGSVGIMYDGLALKPMSPYTWTVDIWTNKGKRITATSRFETGLMSGDHAYEGWSGARWIGPESGETTLYTPYLSVFRLEWTLKMDPESRSMKAGFIYGANDERLLDANMNHWGMETGKDEAYVMVELDMDPLDSGDAARLNVYRIGYTKDDSREKPLVSYPIPNKLINIGNRHEAHTIRLGSEYGVTSFWIDDTYFAANLNLNPVGRGADYIAYPVVGDMGYYVPAGSCAEFSDVTLRHFRSPSNVVTTLDGQKIMAESSDSYKFISLPAISAPMLRTSFKASGKEIERARLYATSRGIYDFYINGQRVGEDYFNPGLTQYNRHHLYQIFDVTSLISGGGNAIGAVLGEGWWSGAATFMGSYWNFFGDRQSLLAKLVITYEDGTTQTLVTDPETWKQYTEGPWAYGSFFQGEVYDATREKAVEGWSMASYDDSAWKPAVEVPLEGHVCLEGTPEIPVPGDFSEFVLEAQYGQTVHAVDTLTAVGMKEARPGVYVYDMGQNMAGVPLITLQGLTEGQRIKLRFAEVKYPDLPEYQTNSGMIMLENIRAAMAQDIYTAKGGSAEVYSPRFTYHGYRYVEITGLDRPLPAEAVKGIVLSSIHETTADYKTSNSKVNKLWENIRWSSLANFLSIPTDCPQRNERLGWAGDISVFSRTATYMTDASQFLRRYMTAMRDTQRADGRFPDVAPLGTGFGGLLWGSAGITVPWECYLQYGDKRLLAEHYEAMKRYIDYVLADTFDKETGLLVQYRQWGDLGDWLGPEHDKNDKSLLWEAYFIYDLDIMTRVAELLGHSSDASRYRSLSTERKDFFRRTYLHPETGKTLFSAFDARREGSLVDTQTSYVLPLVFGIAEGEERERMIENLVNTVTRSSVMDDGRESGPYSLLTGFIGTAWISQALSDSGHPEMAYRLLQQTTYPSWLYSVEQGATTIWERLNSYTHHAGFGGNNSMNSFNHYSFGAVGAWMCSHSLGIRRDAGSVAFKHFILAPEPDPTGEMTSAKGHYDSMYGRIESGWKVNGNTTEFMFTIPANTSATVCLPASEDAEIMIDGRPAAKKSLSRKDGKAMMELSSGHYKVLVSE